ncbi:Imm26 family immunity protein [Neobacillus massiliamazoniensis]|uniref:Uncharacterized protein n=1 Tax=Neobacillus massiliamazoniensis TaxID=1499688 RepID=A0A0U1NRT4_9BACI|nr:Imm26 family immunity protein [Neobacillus massiliamazoniensis]CRK80759.1 hypothetical protein BN000_00647 [Neobacillus massiliamazoniensis]
MQSCISIGKITVNLPDHSSKEFFIFEDLASLFNLESNYEAESFIKERIKENGITKKVDIDSESDFVSIRTRNASVILDIAILINEIANVPINKELLKELNEKLMAFKPPKKQQWGIGDIFSIPLSDNTYYFGQIICVDIETPVCIIFNLNKNHFSLVEITELISAEVLGALGFISDRINNFTFKVINNLPLLRQVDDKVKRNPLIYSQYSSIAIINFCEEIKRSGTSSTYWGLIDNKNYLKKLNCE